MNRTSTGESTHKMANRPPNDGQPWTRDQLILAFELYCRIPFQRTKASDPRVRSFGLLIGKTPAAVARKLGNFGAFDPQLAARNITGLAHGSKLDRAVWDEFHEDWNGLVVRAHELRQSLEPDDGSAPRPSLKAPAGPSERQATVKQRLHQTFFREAVLSSYNARCCITGLPVTECLVAGHIIPWSVDAHRRADPTNGLCLAATFDRLFECGLITILDDFTVRVSPEILRSKEDAVADIANRDGQRLFPPTRFLPDTETLRWHRVHVFRAA